MKSKKLTIALISVAIIVAVSVVGVTFAIWDVTSKNNNFDINVGYNLDFKIANQVNDGGSLKDFAPIATGDITTAITSAKLASFDVVSTTTDPNLAETKLTYTDVTATYTVMAGDVDLTGYVDLYILSAGEYANFTDGSEAPAAEKLLTSGTTKLAHSVAGANQGLVIAWKAAVLANNFENNQEMIKKIANKEYKVVLNFNVAINAA